MPVMTLPGILVDTTYTVCSLVHIFHAQQQDVFHMTRKNKMHTICLIRSISILASHVGGKKIFKHDQVQLCWENNTWKQV